ncbi:MAG: SpoVA/SpoVAEb family sporulation membrane protein [Clostridia bacterium]|nr:SpoVA/SpoVAEb family sporulation membrane protein [Clostridia bacterium]
MSVSKKEYAEMTKKASPNSPLLLDSVKAFLFGGAICAFAEGMFIVFGKMGLGEKSSRSAAMIILIVITAVLTAAGVFDIIAKHAGAGTSVPISGFANSIVATALEFQTEGRILGTAAQMFSIAGPVIVFGCSSAALYGFIYWLFG